VGEQRREVVAGDGATISYVVVDGEAPTVVLLHGLAGSGRELMATARSVGRRAIVIDQRGHGYSTRVPADVSRTAFVDDVARVVTAESAGPVDLVGQSMGAHTAMLVAAAHPELVRKLVLLEGNEGGGSVADADALGAFFRSWEVPFANRDAALAALGSGPLARAWVEDLELTPDGLHPRFDADVMAAVLRAVTVPRWREWESVSAPTLVVYADGGMFSEERKAAFVARGRNVTRVDLADASHDAHLDAFDAWIAAVRGFLAADEGLRPPPQFR
jgi:pimeloyl-ACP methyl ester carboxylesterase